MLKHVEVNKLLLFLEILYLLKQTVHAIMMKAYEALTTSLAFS